MSDPSITAPAAYLSPSSLFILTLVMVVVLIGIKLLLKEACHVPVIGLSLALAFFLFSDSAMLFLSKAINPATQYSASGGIFAVIAISEISYLVAGPRTSPPPHNTD